MYVGKFHKYKIAAICMSELQDDSTAGIARAICDKLNSRGYKTLIFSAFSGFDKMTPTAIGESSIYELINHDIVDVLILMPQSIRNEGVREKIVSTAKERGAFVICVDGYHKDTVSLVYDYVPGFEQMCSHVICHHGCKDIYFMAGRRNCRYSNDLVSIYKKVLEDNGLPFVKEGRFGYGDYWSNPTNEAMNDFFKAGYSIPEAFICVNDVMAVTVIKALRKKGYRVPEDVIVTGFNASQLPTLHAIGEITSSSLDLDYLAQSVADACDNQLAGQDSEGIVRLKYRELYGQSCGCKPWDEGFLSNHMFTIDDYNTIQLNNEIHIANYYSITADKTDYLDMVTEMVEFLESYSGVCVNEDFLFSDEDIEVSKYHNVYSKRMITICQRDRKSNSFDLTYPTENLMPDLDRALKRYDCILFAPLSFHQSVIGYYFTAVEPDKTSFRDTRRLVIATNQILENFRNTYKLTEAYKKISITHRIDPLTSIYNRRGYFTAIEERLAETTSAYLLMLSIDMDRLKQINDNFGHSEGDKAIVEVADAIKAAAGQNGIYARFGGDEFILTLPCGSRREAPKVIGTIQTHIDTYNRKNSGSGYEVSVSVGYKTVKLTDDIDIHKLITETDRLMYVEKRAKKAKAESTYGDIGSTENPYEARIHEIFSSTTTATHFYLDYVESKWHVMRHKDTPPCLCSDTVGPLRSIWLSGCIYPDDKG
ncbi:MAG: diguanylate cyclase, partial [Ruminiclostridium sp.]|nr:diguanylate cyclase [Ruminiclostridium sp.]